MDMGVGHADSGPWLAISENASRNRDRFTVPIFLKRAPDLPRTGNSLAG